MKTAGVVLSKTCRCKRSVTEVTDFVVTEAGGDCAQKNKRLSSSINRHQARSSGNALKKTAKTKIKTSLWTSKASWAMLRWDKDYQRQRTEFFDGVRL